MHRGVDAERDRPVAVDGAGLAFGMLADEHDRVGIRRIVLLVGGGDGGERDPELLEDRAALR